MPTPDERDLERTLLLTESMYVALPKRHPLAKREVVPLIELGRGEWLSGSCPSSCGEAVIGACRAAGFEPRIGFESDDYHVMQGFIAAGLGVTLLPDLALPTLRPELVVRPTDPPAPTPAGLGGDAVRAGALAGDRGDGRDPGRGRRADGRRRRASDSPARPERAYSSLSSRRPGRVVGAAVVASRPGPRDPVLPPPPRSGRRPLLPAIGLARRHRGRRSRAAAGADDVLARRRP